MMLECCFEMCTHATCLSAAKLLLLCMHNVDDTIMLSIINIAVSDQIMYRRVWLQS